MRTFLNHIKNETLDEIETSLENLWQQMIQLSEFFQYSFVLILKRKCLVRACRVRSGESGTPSTIIYTRWSSRRYELGCDTPVGLLVSVGHGTWVWRAIILHSKHGPGRSPLNVWRTHDTSASHDLILSWTHPVNPSIIPRYNGQQTNRRQGFGGRPLHGGHQGGPIV